MVVDSAFINPKDTSSQQQNFLADLFSYECDGARLPMHNNGSQHAEQTPGGNSQEN
jgi:hypothetical protein